PEALALFGVGDAGGVRVEGFAPSNAVVPWGGELSATFGLCVDGDGPRRLRIEYAIEYVKASGARTRKLFKLSERVYAPGEAALSFRQSLRDRTTRKHYPGEHAAAIVVNGAELARFAFRLEEERP
ncbi:MAG TPA: DNA alkylation repair protein, partial [Paenibacillus sp.]|nr:DNA alkylation repair protein [Paenibacillus sp.]